MQLIHEKKVERFYSRGAATRALQEDGFLSFGYWTDKTRDYYQAAEDLLEQVVGQEPPIRRGTILNIACGYGAETFRIFKKLQPRKIVAIDLTEAHVEFAKKKAAEHKLSEHIDFQKMDACQLRFDSNSFAYAIAIEGPAHFKSREEFLRRVYQVLEPGGVLLLSDIIVNNEQVQKNWFNKFLSRLCAKHWHMPRVNWMTADEFGAMLDAIGFEQTNVRSIGKHVYPGFARFNLKFSSIFNAMRVRGIRLGIGLTFISWLLAFLFRRGILEYALVRAAKAQPSPPPLIVP